MSQININNLSPEQAGLIPVYREKWRAIGLSTQTINRQQASEAVKEIYGLIGLAEPEIIFCTNPLQALQLINTKNLTELYQNQWIKPSNSIKNKLFNSLETQLLSQLDNPLLIELENQLWQPLRQELWANFFRLTRQELDRHLDIDILNRIFSENIRTETWLASGSLFDYCINALECNCRPNLWLNFYNLAHNFYLMFNYDKLTIICDRPLKIYWDKEPHPHAEAGPAIEFADNWQIFAYYVIVLPEKYGKMHPHQWQAKWLLKEQNPTLRQLLIREIGYSRICQELPTIQLDQWKEYTLLKIPFNLDVEPIFLVKMTCQSTGSIHTLRVPPDIKSAREASSWINWGIDPEQFSTQT